MGYGGAGSNDDGGSMDEVGERMGLISGSGGVCRGGCLGDGRNATNATQLWQKSPQQMSTSANVCLWRCCGGYKPSSFGVDAKVNDRLRGSPA